MNKQEAFFIGLMLGMLLIGFVYGFYDLVGIR